MEQMHIELSCVLNESLETHYLIYKITNIINGKYYIGQHQTQNVFDNYNGSGYYLNKAQQKYGLSAFIKTILYDFATFEEMDAKEKELVQLSNCFPYDPMSYNLKEGGYQGQLSKYSIAIGNEHRKQTFKNKTPEEKAITRQKISEKTSGKNNGMYGYKWSDEQRKHQSEVMKGRNSYESLTEEEYLKCCEKIRQSKLGDKNPMYGKNSEDFMTEEAIMRKREKMRQHQLNTKRMINPSIKLNKIQ